MKNASYFEMDCINSCLCFMLKVVSKCLTTCELLDVRQLFDAGKVEPSRRVWDWAEVGAPEAGGRQGGNLPQIRPLKEAFTSNSCLSLFSSQQRILVLNNRIHRTRQSPRDMFLLLGQISG